MVLVMLQEYLDILDVHLGDDFPGTAEFSNVLIVPMHSVSIKLVIWLISCSLQRFNCLGHLCLKFKRKT